MKKDKRLLKEFLKNRDFVDLIFLVEMLEIKVDYLLSKDLEITSPDDSEEDDH